MLERAVFHNVRIVAPVLQGYVRECGPPALDDAFNNWFPHVSPDGRWIVFLPYAEPGAPSDHPPAKRVSPRLMPAAGGPPRVLAYLDGGQGTINVPSWSPDSRRLAFVSNPATL